MKQLKVITENQRVLEELRCELSLCMYKAKEEGIEVVEKLNKLPKKGRRIERLKMMIRTCSNALLEI